MVSQRSVSLECLRSCGRRRGSRFVSLLIAVAGCAALAPGVSNAATVVYERHPGDNETLDGNLWVSDDGASPSVLPIWGVNPVLSPEGRRILYADDSSLFVTDVGGNQTQEILEFACFCWPNAQWEHDGQGIVTDDYPRTRTSS